jgi:hypothetical protein
VPFSYQFYRNMPPAAIQPPLLAIHSSIRQLKSSKAKAYFEMLLEGMDPAQIKCGAWKMCIVQIESQQADANVSVLLGGVDLLRFVCGTG